MLNIFSYKFIFVLFGLKFCFARMVKFTKDTRIINIGHLPAHTTGKVDILLANGFTDVTAMLCESTPVDVFDDLYS